MRIIVYYRNWVKTFEHVPDITWKHSTRQNTNNNPNPLLWRTPIELYRCCRIAKPPRILKHIIHHKYNRRTETKWDFQLPNVPTGLNTNTQGYVYCSDSFSRTRDETTNETQQLSFEPEKPNTEERKAVGDWLRRDSSYGPRIKGKSPVWLWIVKHIDHNGTDVLEKGYHTYVLQSVLHSGSTNNHIQGVRNQFWQRPTAFGFQTTYGADGETLLLGGLTTLPPYPTPYMCSGENLKRFHCAET